MIIKAGSITNLTDARFFAAQEVNYIGFNFDPQSPDYISPTNALAIKGWISGPKIVAEFANQDMDNIKNIIEFLQPDIMELNASEFQPGKFDLPLIIRTDNNLPDISDVSIIYYLSDKIQLFSEKLMIRVDDFNSKLPEHISAIEIKGTKESEIGMKDYELLSDFIQGLKSNKE